MKRLATARPLPLPLPRPRTPAADGDGQPDDTAGGASPRRRKPVTAE